MRYDAGKENWMPMEIRGVQGYFSDLRIDRASVPGWLHFRELADGDSDGIPAGTSRKSWPISMGPS